MWLGPGIHTSANFVAASEGHISLGPASRKVALNPGYGVLGVMVFCSKYRAFRTSWAYLQDESAVKTVNLNLMWAWP